MSAQNTPYQPWMRSLLNRMKELYGKSDAKTISEALPDGDFFQIKGAVDEVSDLPASDNNIGDIYIVSEDGGEYIWVTSEDHPNGYWEQLGVNITPESIGAEPAKLVVTVTENGSVLSADKTFEELEIAYENGNTIVLKDEYGMSYPLVAYSAVGTMDFSIVADGKTKTFSVVYGYPTAQPDTWSYSETTLQVAPTAVTVSGTTPTITPSANTVYNCGELTSLTISNPTATGAYSIVFTSGSTATTTTIPATILGLEDFAAEANTLYEINVLNNRSVVGSWAVSA